MFMKLKKQNVINAVFRALHHPQLPGGAAEIEWATNEWRLFFTPAYLLPKLVQPVSQSQTYLA